MKPDKETRARAIQTAIRGVLLHDWDPIHVADEAEARDEYDGYVGGVYRLLVSSASVEQIAEHLARIETESMGLSPQPHRLIPVAEKLRGINVALDSSPA